MENDEVLFPEDIYLEHLTTINGVDFTPREIDVIACQLNGRGQRKEVAKFLSISENTVRTHIQNISLKINKQRLLDFVSISPARSFIHTYYLSLNVQLNFEKNLKEISKFTDKENQNHLIIYWKDQKLKDELLHRLNDHLNQAGIKAEIREQMVDQKIEFRKDQDCILILLLEKKNQQAAIQEILCLDSIDISEYKNYYFVIFEILKKVFHNVNVENILTSFWEHVDVVGTPSTINNYKAYANGKTFDTYESKIPYKTIRVFIEKKWHFVSAFFVIGVVSIGFLKIKNKDKNEVDTPHTQTTHIKQEKEDGFIRSDLLVPTESILLQRPELIVKLDDKFKGQKGIQTVALVGPGGSGKTTLARQYFHKQNAKDVWEINAENNKTLSGSFEKLAYVLAQTEKEKAKLQNLHVIKDLNERKEKILFLVKEKLKLRSNWLLIYDNVVKFTDVLNYFPNDFNVWGEGKVIVTTRDSNILNNKYINNTLQIGELSQDEKLTLFMKIQKNGEGYPLNISQVGKAKKFLEQIPSYPLDVSLASYYIKVTNISYNMYLDNLKKNNKDFEITQENILKESAEYTKTRYGIVSLSLKDIINIHKDFEALLLLVSLLNSQDIPRDLLDIYKSNTLVDNFIFHLKKYSLIINKSSSLLHEIPTISMHQNTQEIILMYLSEKLKLMNDNSLLLQIVNILRTYTATAMVGEDPSRMNLLANHYETFLNHRNMLTEEMIDFIYCDLGCIYFHLGNYQKAENALERALTNLKKNNSKYFLQIAQTLLYLGIVNRELGDYEKANTFLEQSITIYKNYNFGNKIEMAKALSYLGLTHKNLGNCEKSKELLEESLNIYKRYFPQNHVGIARTLSHLGINYREMGNYEKAKEFLEESLNVYKNNLPEEQIFIARTLGYLGIVYRELGYYEKTKDLLEESLIIYRKYLPENYLEIAVNLMYLGNAYRELGNYQKAKESLEESLLIYKNSLPSNIVDRVIAITFLGKVYRELGNYRKAKDLFEESLRINRKYYSENQLDIPWVLILLGHIYKQLGDYEKAKDLVEQALKIHRKFLPENHIDIAWNLAVVGDIYGYLGLYTQANTALQNAFEAYKKHFAFKENHIKMGWILLYLGTFYKNSKDYEKAKKTFEECLSIYETNFGRTHIETARILRNLGEVHLQLGYLETAENLTNEALEVFQKNSHSESFMCLENLAELYMKKSDKTKLKINKQQYNNYMNRSINYLKQALEVAKDHFPENSRHITKIQFNLMGLLNKKKP